MKLMPLLERIMMGGVTSGPGYAQRARRPFKATTEETEPQIDENGDYIDEGGRVWKGWKPLGKKK